MSGYGILAGIADPEFMARMEERRRIAERVADQMGCTVQEAREALDHFEIDLCSCGQTLH
jgi:hypothetical protein